jgi:diguanylate cyclase (GGDEF)-like protein
MAEHEPVEQYNLDTVAPAALIRFTDGTQLTDANTLTLTLLGRPLEELMGRRFADLLFEDDAERLGQALTSANDVSSPPIVVRWGESPPVMTLSLRLQREADRSPTTVLAAITDLSDQYRLDTILCGGGSGVFITDFDRRVTWVSPMTESVLGIPPETLLGVDIATLVHPDDQPALLEATEELITNPGLEVTRTYRLRHPLIEQTWWRLRTTSTWLPNDPAIGGVASRIELTIEADDTGAGGGAHPPMTLAEMTPSGLLMAAGGHLTFRNNLARQLLGPVADTDDDQAWVDELRPAHRQAVRDVLRAARDGHREAATAALDRPGEPTLWIRVLGAPATDDDGHVVGYVATLLDVTTETETREQLQRAQEQLWQLANHDQLTGLANRMQFGERLEGALARLRRDGRPVAVLYGDLDRFKPVNDRLGHAAGDEVLVVVAERLSEATRQTDTVCRFGGDEFLIICEGFGDPGAIVALAERLVGVVAEPILVGDTTMVVGMSIGMAIADLVSTEGDLLARSDAALYRAKQAGRGQVVVAD